MNNNSSESIIRKFVLLYIISTFICNFCIFKVLLGGQSGGELYALPLYTTVVGIVPTAIYLFYILATRTDILSSKPSAKEFFRVFMFSGIATAVYFLAIYFVFFYEKGIFRSELAGLVKDYMQYSTGLHFIILVVSFFILRKKE